MKHKCADCGFLAIKNLDTRQLCEAEQDYRDKGQGIEVYIREGANVHSVYENKPICFARAYNLIEEYGGVSKNYRADFVYYLVTKVRDCDDFIDWYQGSSPKEHREMLDRKLELKRLEMQENRHNREEWARYIFLCIVTILAALIATKVI